MRLTIVLDEIRARIMRQRAKRKDLPVATYARSILVEVLDDPQERRKDEEFSGESEPKEYGP